MSTIDEDNGTWENPGNISEPRQGST